MVGSSSLTTPASHYKLVAPVGSLPSQPLQITIIPYEAAVNPNPKLTGSSIIEIDEAKMTLTRVCEITLTGSAPLG